MRRSTSLAPSPFARLGILVLALVSAAFGSLAVSPTGIARADSIGIASATFTEGDSGSANAFVTVSYNLSLSRTFTIAVAPVAPANGADISTASVQRTVNGFGSINVPIQVFGDLDREAAQVANLTLTVVLVPEGSVTRTATLTVVDNDHPTAAISDASGSEGNGITHTVSLSKAINQATQLRIQSFAGGNATVGADLNSVNTVVTVPANALAVTVNVPTIEDAVVELDSTETYNLIMSAVTAGDISFGAGSDLNAVGTINDDDTGTLRSAKIQLNSDSSVFTCRDELVVGEPFNGSVDVTFKLTLSANNTTAFEFELFTDGSPLGPNATSQDFTAIDSVRIFPAGTRTATFTIRFHDDGQSEGDEFLTVRAIGGLISETQPCNQNHLGAESFIRIPFNVF